MWAVGCVFALAQLLFFYYLFGLRAAHGPFGLAHIFCGLYRAGLKSPDVNSGWNFKVQARKKIGPFGPAHSGQPILTTLDPTDDLSGHFNRDRGCNDSKCKCQSEVDMSGRSLSLLC